MNESFPTGNDRSQTPDLLIMVHLDLDSKGIRLRYQVKASRDELGLSYREYKSGYLNHQPQDYFKKFFVEIENRLSVLAVSQRAHHEMRYLEDMGHWLYEELFPDALQDQLWQIYKRVRSVQILTDEDTIPWGLCKLQGSGAKGYAPGPFFCEAFELACYPLGLAAHHVFPMRKMAVVHRKNRELPRVLDEIQTLESFSSIRREITRIPALVDDLRQAMAEGTCDSWHIAGHGDKKDGDVSVIKLDDKHTLKPESLTGELRNIGNARPLVFWNFCYSGRSGLSLTRVDGWAAKFIRSGAGGFIGALWAVDDEAAHTFAVHFYKAFLSGATLGAAVHEAREALRPRGDGSWLAYVLYGQSLANVETAMGEVSGESSDPVLFASEQWREATSLLEWHTDHVPVLAALAVCQEAIPVEILVRFAGSDLAVAEKVLDYWHECLDVRVIDGHVRYAVSASLLEHITGHAGEDGLDLQAANERVVDVLAEVLAGT